MVRVCRGSATADEATGGSSSVAGVGFEGSSIMEKRCSKCKEMLPIESFGKDKRHSDGLKSHCRQCLREYQAKYNASHREHYRTYHKLHYATHKEEILAS